ncbi:ABC-three component system middle component 1 [Bacillus sp. B1-b2]|uniref:ABC-three component system middle component 1 n=1 Tax=Bacillus sp. B1-b2 TaxID=2653201 RepID=UPI001261AE5A|nr:ABC-three component system middle component 1 [Bacillus sp. B1-b2]KAB7665555.1 hypothetical protein F9279_20230 [Bacillus sp. B1-b2]
MISDLYSLFENYGKLQKFTQLEFAYIDRVYASPEQIFGIASFETEEQLLDNWEKSADELAVKIQGRLNGDLRDLKWDIYLILFVQQYDILTINRKVIENDRQYFKKIILTMKDHPFSQKLPLTLEIQLEDELIVFNDFHFLQELKNHLETDVIERIGSGFFEGDYTAEDTLKKIVSPYVDRGEKNEN